MRGSPMQILRRQNSPSFKLFLADIKPIAKRVAIDVWKAGLALVLTALASEEVRAVVVNHFGLVAGVGFGTFLTAVGVGRWLRDNTAER